MNKLSIIERNVRSQLRRMNTSGARQKQTPTEYCLQLVRYLPSLMLNRSCTNINKNYTIIFISYKNNDYENFLCTLLLPRGIKSAAFAVRAFNVEVAQVEDQVRDSRIGAMRLQFWTDALNGIYNDSPPRSPVALELHRILQRHKLSKRYFKRLIDARLNKLSGSIFVDLESLERYCDYTTSSIYYLLLEAQGTASVNADHAASHFGRAYGLVTLIRSVPYNARKRVMVLSQDILLKNGVSSESIFQGQSSAGFQDAVLEVASCARQHLKVATSLKKKAGKDLNVIFLPTVCVENYLEKLRKADFDVFHPTLQKRNGILPLQLLWRKIWS
ncbi:NADH dehydrogenase (ubiquinone) complex I, assembly factor 6 homolog sicily isoform X1 [Temnothorax americanus]|uniref:NADH dehydrogenase (ubiquinone) complex I, assembly factor 6 homolog sicily isoform X1 n=1 Tax=Temnothorax americanus TaxID=1964332 RepID=UPI0040694D1F